MPKISIIIPCYYNEENIPITTTTLLENEKRFPQEVEFQYVMVDDGSKDNTYKLLQQFKKQYPEKVRLIKLSGNFGSYNAILAGMKYADGDCNVVLAADLQDPVELIPKMYDYWCKGIKLVIAHREKREDSFFQKIFASVFQWMLQKLALPNLPKGGFDFVLFDKVIREELLLIDEKNSNSLYLMLWLRYDYVTLPYTRKLRKIGKSRWTFSKKLKLFVDSFVAFSFFPIRAITFVGFILACFAIVYAIIIVIERLRDDIPIPGWSAMMIVLLTLSSFQMIALGVIGEYLWRTLDAVRKRPNYVIDDVE